MGFERRQYGALHADVITRQQLYDTFRRALETGAPLRVTYANAHNVNVAEYNAAYRAALQLFHIVFPEGVGMALAARMLGYHRHEMFHTTDFWETLFPLFRERGARLFLLGSTRETLVKAERCFVLEGMPVAGTADGYGDVDNSEQLFAAIRAASPDVLFVGMGVPRQELWVAEHSSSLDIPVVVCVGNFLEFYAGTVPRAPRFMRAMHLEWFHRMLVEPRRLWKRYVIGIPKFLFRMRG